ncbi:hypothetical protein [Haladaptatus sp. CMSO5]|uniref:hypothetical protein n=1 Tax=Haladaptatus sp. CMSO5 TaxID=3120514 RepID=UPI002FCDFE4B
MMNQKAAIQLTRLFSLCVGLLLASVPALDDFAAIPYDVLAGVPLLFAGLLCGLYFGTSPSNRDTRLGFVGAGIGVCALFVAAIFLVQSGSQSGVSFLIIGLPAVTGFGVFSIMVAYILSTSSEVSVPRWIPIALVVTPLVDPLANAVITPMLSVGLSITGLVWVGFGLTLRGKNQTLNSANATTSHAN